MRYYYDSTLLLLLVLALVLFGTIHISVVSAEPVNFVDECPDKIEVRKEHNVKREINSMILMRIRLR